MKRYAAGDFTDYRRPTIGADFMTKEVVEGDQPMLLQVSYVHQPDFKINSLVVYQYFYRVASFERIYYTKYLVSFLVACRSTQIRSIFQAKGTGRYHSVSCPLRHGAANALLYILATISGTGRRLREGWYVA